MTAPTVLCPRCGRQISARIPASEQTCPRDAGARQVKRIFDIPIEVAAAAVELLSPTPNYTIANPAAIAGITRYAKALAAAASEADSLVKLRRRR